MHPTARLSTRLTIALVLLALLGVLGGARPGGAQDGSTAKAEPPSWAVEPSSAEGPTGRAAFIYEAEPGQVIDDVLGISNLSDEPQTFKVYGADAFGTDDGGFALIRGDETSKDLGSWVTFGADEYTVPPNSRLDLPFKIDVPANATPGDHAGGAVAAVLEEGDAEDGQRVDIDRRVAARIYLRVDGPLDPSLAIEKVDLSYRNPAAVVAGAPMTVTYQVRNTGNVRLTGTVRVSAAGPGGLLNASAKPTSLPELLPGATVTQTARIEGVRPTFRITAEVEVSPEPVGGVTGKAPETVTRTSSQWAVPWALVALIVAFVVWRRLRRRRIRRRAGDPDGTATRGAGADPADDADADADGVSEDDASDDEADALVSAES